MILQAKHLTKQYGNHMAVDDIQLEFEKRKFQCYFGTQWCREINHHFHVNRFEKSRHKVRFDMRQIRKSEWFFQASVLDEMLTVRENLTIRAQQYKEIAASRVDDLIHQLGLTAFQKQLYGTLSGGQKTSG